MEGRCTLAETQLEILARPSREVAVGEVVVRNQVEEAGKQWSKLQPSAHS